MKPSTTSKPSPASHKRVTQRSSSRRAATDPRSVPILAPEREAEQQPDQPFVEGAEGGLDPDLRHRLISEAAYRRFADRGYADGYDVDDWLQAEAEVDHLLLNPEAAASLHRAA